MQIRQQLRQWVKGGISQVVRHGLHLAQNNMAYGHENPYLDGIFAPQRQEYEAHDLHVEGEIPQQLNGALLRIGPNPIQVKNPKIHHWFVGDGMIHALRLQQGQALYYKSRYVGADEVQQKLKRPRIQGESRGVASAVNTNIIAFAGKIWALVEAGALPIEVDAELNSQRHQLLEDQQDFPFTAHPHIDPVTGDIHAVCYDALVRDKVFYLHFNAQGKLKHHVDIPVQHGPMIHDCAITQSHVLILDLSVNFSLQSAFKGSLLPYAFNPKHQARIGLLPFQGQAQDIQWFELEPCFIFHVANAFDLANGDVVLDAVVHSKALVDSIQGPIEDQDIGLERFTFERASGQVKRQILSTQKQEFPRINEAYTGREHRYIYSISFAEFDNPSAVRTNVLLCHDVKLGTTAEYALEDTWVSGEVIFVARDHAQAENDGWLMAYVHALDSSPSKVLIWQADAITAGPIATIHLPVRVPLGFHANWIDDRQLHA